MRVFLSIEHTERPQVVLHVLGREICLSEDEVNDLIAELSWAKGRVAKERAEQWASLATKYRSAA